MSTSSARFVKSAKQASDFPKDKKPEIAFCGRSNSGKSSLLNVLTNSRGLARTSSSPGRTQLINFFLIDGKTYYVDLPGYGYAKVPKGIRDTWGEMIEGYLRNREPLKLAIMLVDSRMPPTDSDLVMKEWLDHFGIPSLVVLTKSDKITRNEQTKALNACAKKLQTKEIIVFSAVTGFGKDAVLKKIRETIDHNPTQ
ncbi:MAG TPA: ribosome biogenesis GTP-binding protein YihA/YsxC [Terriglobia bacterium]|nr:ribosome biogenesis GTP-binding protein YihA/YsxC [Terriglobia bacterium]